MVFDAVGTVIEPIPSVGAAYRLAGERHGSTLGVDEIQSRFPEAMRLAARNDREFATSEDHERRRWETVVAYVFHDVPDTSQVFADLWQHFAEPRNWQLYDDVEKIWSKLRQNDLTIAIGSNFDQRVKPICATLPLLRDCTLYWSAQIRVRKPGLVFYEHIAEDMEVPPERLLMVGDDITNDYLGAVAAGWQARLIARDERSRDRAASQVPHDHIISSLDQLAELLAL